MGFYLVNVTQLFSRSSIARTSIRKEAETFIEYNIHRNVSLTPFTHLLAVARLENVPRADWRLIFCEELSRRCFAKIERLVSDVTLLISVAETNPASDATELGALDKFDVTGISNTPKVCHIRRFDGLDDLRLCSLGAYEWQEIVL
ncbi:hypothetical protein TNIN_173471 [Trichonephila inaurata madagascariensis]|uniref:Uncharacterized protein n=1 Tax=Trichonephila inaurata madagascariensis TaxID=2747483 RepID=A0A8X6YVD8_9ARAC|nr:hypothetical protein TNIN_173471 [Trichonephila inaurata madagascariensis]